MSRILAVQQLLSLSAHYGDGGAPEIDLFGEANGAHSEQAAVNREYAELAASFAELGQTVLEQAEVIDAVLFWLSTDARLSNYDQSRIRAAQQAVKLLREAVQG